MGVKALYFQLPIGFPPFLLLYFRCKHGAIFARRCFCDVGILNLYTGHLPVKILLQPVDRYQIYDTNSTSALKTIKRPKLIKLLQTPFPFGFNDSIYHKGDFQKCLNLISLFWNIKTVKQDRIKLFQIS